MKEYRFTLVEKLGVRMSVAITALKELTDTEINDLTKLIEEDKLDEARDLVNSKSVIAQKLALNAKE